MKDVHTEYMSRQLDWCSGSLSCIGVHVPERNRVQQESRTGHRWLRKGASLGVRWCWSELADIYLKSNPRELDNGRKCLRRFFDRSEISALNDEQEREFFFRLRSYGDLCNPASPDFSEDSAVFEHAATELLEKIASIGPQRKGTLVLKQFAG